MTYKFGGQKSAYCNHLLAVPRMEYLGISLMEYEKGWLDLSTRDISLALSILKHTWMGRLEFEVVRRELQLGLFLQKKAEMNIAGKTSIEVTEHVERILSLALSKRGVIL